MNIERRKRFLINVSYFGAIALIAALCLRYLLTPMLPFLIGFLIAWVLHRPSKAIARRLRIAPRIPALVLTIAFYAVVVTVVLLASLQAISGLRQFLPRLPQIYTHSLLPFLDQSLNVFEEWMTQFDPSIAQRIDSLAGEIYSATEQGLTDLSASLLLAISGLVTSLPTVIVRVILTVVATFFASIDFDRIIAFLKRLLPSRIHSTLGETIRTAVVSFWKILLSYVLIMLLSFVELSVGFLIMRIPYAMGIALLVAFIDILPVLGTGLVLIPWAVIAGFLGNIPIAVGMALLYVFMLVVRNIVEPRLVGKQIGLHPLVTLISMFVGMHLFGLIGLFGFPLALSLLVQLVRSGAISLPRPENADSAQD